MNVKAIENEFEAKVFLNSLPEVFDYDSMCSFCDIIFYDEDTSRGLLSSIYLLSILNKKYGNTDNAKYQEFYINRSREISEDFFEFFKYISDSNEVIFNTWSKLFEIFKRDRNLINNLIHNDLSHSSCFLYLIEKFDLNEENRDLVSKWIYQSIDIRLDTFNEKLYNYSEDLQKAILKENKENFIKSRKRYFDLFD